MKTISIRLPDEDWALVERFARADQRSLSNALGFLVRAGLRSETPESWRVLSPREAAKRPSALAASHD